MLSFKLKLKFSLLSTFVCCSIGVITLFVNFVVFTGSFHSVHFIQQFLTVFTWRAFGFFFKENISLATNSQGVFFLLADLRNISIILSSNSFSLELYFISLPPPLRFSYQYLFCCPFLMFVRFLHSLQEKIFCIRFDLFVVFNTRFQWNVVLLTQDNVKSLLV